MNGLDAALRLQREGFQLDVSMSIADDTTVALLGPNGSGKSTTAELLSGLLAIDAGHVTLHGNTLDDPTLHIFVPPAERRVGLVFQDQRLFDHLRVIDNVAFGLRCRGASKQDSQREAMAWLDQLELGDLAQKRPQQLSGGQAQRVAIARALAMNPELLILDEPFSAIDIAARGSLRTWLRQSLDVVACPTLIITHDPSDAFVLADRIDVIEMGEIVQSGDADALRRHPASPFVAALSGINLLQGTNEAGDVSLSDTNIVLRAANTSTTGKVLVTISPTAVALHQARPEGSPRNSWQTRIASLEYLGDRVRVGLDSPLLLSVDVTPGAIEALELGVGSTVWASVKATEIGVESTE